MEWVVERLSDAEEEYEIAEGVTIKIGRIEGTEDEAREGVGSAGGDGESSTISKIRNSEL